MQTISKKRRYPALLACVLILLSCVIKVGAVSTGFKTVELTQEEKEAFIAYIDMHRIEQEPARRTIAYFDVNADGLIAVAQLSTGKEVVCVYSDDGIFQYGYTFDCYGAVAVEWDEKNLNVYFVRSGKIVSLTPSGEILDVLERDDHAQENTYYYNHDISANKKTVGDTEYFIRSDLGVLNFFASAHSRIVVKEANGTERIIYDVNAAQFGTILVAVIAFVGFFSGIIITIVRKTVEKQQGHGHGQGDGSV